MAIVMSRTSGRAVNICVPPSGPIGWGCLYLQVTAPAASRTRGVPGISCCMTSLCSYLQHVHVTGRQW